jgi:putative nucleotidyltransferase with HDIG domain
LVTQGISGHAGTEATKNGHRSSAAWVGAALEASLRARAPSLQASTQMLRPLVVKVSRQMKFDAQAQALLDIAVGVRDIGMIALPDRVVLATTPLAPADWELVNRHPVIGQQLLDGLFVVSAAAGIVRAHHERWDGGGYPDGVRGEAIPVISRVISTCDAFIAIASDRPHRRGIGAEAALEHVCQESGSQFDPRTVDALVAALGGERELRPTTHVPPGLGLAPRGGSGARRARHGGRDLTSAIEELDVIPAFAPAHERLLAATATVNISGGELVAAIESDTGLTVAVLRRAQDVGGRRVIANVADAVASLGPTEIQVAIEALPRTEFPWRTSQLEVLMHHSRVHAQAVARAADRISREVELAQRDDVLVAALLHDIGKLVLGRAFSEYTSTTERTSTPEERIRAEQRAWGMDHASVGALLLRRWRLPERLVSTVAAHHSSAAEGDVATYVRLADMVVHHAQGDPVDRSEMLSLAYVCGLSAPALRAVLFDLPHAGGSQRRRAEPSPLSKRQTAVLRILAQGKVYQAIAVELGVTTSTVRSHLHSIYGKLGVDDRAQAVLRATEMGCL